MLKHVREAAIATTLILPSTVGTDPAAARFDKADESTPAHFQQAGRPSNPEKLPNPPEDFMDLFVPQLKRQEVGKSNDLLSADLSDFLKLLKPQLTTQDPDF